MTDDSKLNLPSSFKETTYPFESNPFDFELPQILKNKNEDKKYEGVSNMSNLFYPDAAPVNDNAAPLLFRYKPDADSIKMFVGQIPQHFNESELIQMFETFGKIYELKVLRDKLTGRSKGCCFVTFFTRNAALNAQNALHNIKVMPGMHHPIQMKPADCENRTDRKLFVGMLSKKFSESDVRNLFSPYGAIEECTVLRDSNKQSKGCAFLTYLTRQSAQNAVKSMHHSHVFEGCSSPMVVKFADTQKDKELRRMQTLGSEMYQKQLSQILQNNSLSRDALPTLITPNNLFQQLQNNGYMNPQFSIINQATLPQNPVHRVMAVPSVSLQNLSIAGNYALNPYGTQNMPAMAVNDGLILNNFLTQLNSCNPVGMAFLPQGHPESPYPTVSPGVDHLSRRYSWERFMVAKQIEGPDGANLFIYHLPLEFTDQRLADLFKPFGRVVSAKVFIDKVTRLSKCFGFVSYDNLLSAKVAIQNLNGYSICGKKLKVEVKKKKYSQV